MLYLDLDIVICGELDRFFDYEKGEYCVAENWTQIGKNIGNTSCYRFPVGRYKHIFDDFNSDPQKLKKNMASPRNTSVMLSAKWFTGLQIGL